jgi:hypothetical protein
LHWTRKTIIEHIKQLHAQGVELNYTSAERDRLNLVRAAAWHFGTWRLAVEAADVDYESLSKYRRWNRERIIERIKELHAQGADLSWRAVSTQVDPPLAAAALRSNGFPSWREAIAAAGLDIEDVARYRFWDEARVIEVIRELHVAGHPLSSKAMQTSDQSLFCAARRRFGSWDKALIASGLDVEQIRLRRPKITKKKSVAPRNAHAENGVSSNGHAENGHAENGHVGAVKKRRAVLAR